MKVSPKEIRTAKGVALVLRSPEEKDAQNMLGFLRTLLHESTDNLNAPADWFDKTSSIDQIATITDFLSKDKEFFLSAFDQGACVGNLVLNALTAPANRHCGQLAMGVLRELQGQGVGTALMDYCLEVAKEIGIWNIRFTVRTHNTPAIRLYERMGFHRIGLLKGVARVGDQYRDEYLYQGIFR